MDLPELRFLVGDQFLDIDSATKEGPRTAIETIFRCLVFLPLEEYHFIRIRLGESFRRAFQSEPKRKPYGLSSIISSAQDSKESSIESILYRKGEDRAVVAYAVAAADDKRVVDWAKSIPGDELGQLAESTIKIKASRGFLRILTGVEENKYTPRIKHVRGPKRKLGRRAKISAPEVECPSKAEPRKPRALTGERRSRHHANNAATQEGSIANPVEHVTPRTAEPADQSRSQSFLGEDASEAGPMLNFYESQVSPEDTVDGVHGLSTDRGGPLIPELSGAGLAEGSSLLQVGRASLNFGCTQTAATSFGQPSGPNSNVGSDIFYHFNAEQIMTTDFDL